MMPGPAGRYPNMAAERVTMKVPAGCLGVRR